MKTYRAQKTQGGRYIVEVKPLKKTCKVKIGSFRIRGWTEYNFTVKPEIGRQAVDMIEQGQPAVEIGTFLLFSSNQTTLNPAVSEDPKSGAAGS